MQLVVCAQAFGQAPAGGTLPDQQRVGGFKGKGLVNTYLGGDEPVGKLISPEFTIERPYIGFLIGGGGHEDKTCINLKVGGRTVRTAMGAHNSIVCQDADDPNNVTVYIEVASLDAARQFISSEDLGQAMQAAGVLEQPTVRFLSSSRQYAT